MIFWICLASVLAALVLYFRQVYSRFRRYGVQHWTPIPLLGNAGRAMLRLDHIAVDLAKYYNAFPKERFVGRYNFMMPIVLIRDLDLIRRITINDFDHFHDHKINKINKNTDELFGSMLLSLEGQEWKDMRSTLSPAFTSSKIRLMVPLMVEVGDHTIKVLKDKIQVSGVEYIDIDVKDLTTRYANDVIASCAFGLKVDSRSEENNQFYVSGQEVTDTSFKRLLKFLGLTMFPQLMKKLNVSIISEETRHFFKSLIINTMQDREERRIIRPDLIHLLMEARKGQLKHDDKVATDADTGFATVEESAVGKEQINRVWSDDDLIAQAVLFFIAGFETVSSVMTFLLYELAVNSDIQEKLVQEIKVNNAKNDGKFDYNSIQQMTYLDMVVSEVLRLWPPAIALDRVCTKKYNLGRPDDNATEDYIIRVGEGVGIPTFAIHRDPEYFPDPEHFDPERFSEQNKHNIKPFSYIPFGLGPRNCIGSRFALCEVKVMTYQILQCMKVSPAPKTQIPAKLSKASFGLRMEGGHWLRLKVRN